MEESASKVGQKFHEKFKKIKVAAHEIFFQEGLTQFFHERGVLHGKCVG